MLNSTDKFLVNDGSVTETVDWSDIKSELFPMTVTVVLTPDKPEVGEEVTALPVTVSGQAPYTYTYQWVTADDALGSNQTDIVGATSNTYTPVSNDTNKFLGCTVVSTDDLSNSATGTGYATTAVNLALVIAKPSVLTPPDGAGVGGDVTFTPETSAITGVVDVSITEPYDNLITTPNPEGAYGVPENCFDGDSATEYGIDGSKWQAWGGIFRIYFDKDPNFVDGTHIGKTLDVFWGVNTSGSTQRAHLRYLDGTDTEVNNGTAGGRSSLTITKPVSYLYIQDRNNSPYYATINRIELDGTILTGGYTSGTGKQITLTDPNTYDEDGNDMGQSISETFTAGQTVKGEKTSGTYGAPTPAFSTTTYRGTGASQVINTGINNTGKALVWMKCRTLNENNLLQDTIRGTDGILSSNLNNGNQPNSFGISSFNDNGYTLNTNVWSSNTVSQDIVAWNFRAAPGFFDIVTYDGTGSAQDIPHSLGTAPGMYVCKRTDASSNWVVYHKGIGNEYTLQLNGNSGKGSSNAQWWNNTDPTDAVFSIGTAGAHNTDGGEYVAYLFADTPGVIKCGGYPGSGVTRLVDCGFKPGWVLIKRASAGADWVLFDSARGDNKWLAPNLSNSEGNMDLSFEANGFQIIGGISETNKLGDEYIYVAIAEDALAGEFAPTGELTADADPNGPTMALTNTSGDWEEPGLKVINDHEATKEGPGASNTVFTSSEPKLNSGSVTVWGEADWQLSTSSDFSTDVQVKSVPLTNLGVQTGPTFTLEDGTDYFVRTQYTSAIPAQVSPVSAINHFKTAGAGVPNVKDAFSTTLYANSAGDSEIIVETGVNNTDKALVWFKNRDNSATNHKLYDTLRGPEQLLESSDPQGNQNNPNSLLEFLDNGVKVGSGSGLNTSGNMVAWNFRAAPGFFDVVTYEGDGVAGKTVAHDLGSVPGMIIVKSLDNAQWWVCYHHSLGNTKGLYLNASITEQTNTFWNDTDPTSTDFTLGTITNTNDAGVDYIAYLFADTPGVIKCGKWTADQSGTLTVTTGFKVGWLMFKRASGSTAASDWYIFDVKRGMVNNGSNQPVVRANSPDAEFPSFKFWNTDTGFATDEAVFVHEGGDFIYVAIADPTTTAYYDEVNSRQVSQHELVRRFGVDADTTDLRNQGIYPLVNQPTGMTDAFVKEGDVYRAIPSRSMEIFHAQQEAEEANERLDAANASIESLRSSLEARIAALEADTTDESTSDPDPDPGSGY